MKSMKITQVIKAKGKRASLYLVEDAFGQILGQLEKYIDSKAQCHPWKAYKGNGMGRRFLKAFYAEDGGREAAIREIINS